jgi:23S rRNA pseudouridine2605 synthase
MAKPQRVQKFLAHQGIGSRRSIEKMINAGRIAVNDQVITEQGTKIDPDTDRVAVDGQVIENQGANVYYWLNKPAGVVSSSVSQAGEPTVLDHIDSPVRIYPVGRLDKESRGLMLLTNDGLLTHRLTHPKFHINKTYEVTVTGKITAKGLYKLRTGIPLVEGKTAPAQVELIAPETAVKNPGRTSDEHRLRFMIHEGKFRQIRRMCTAVNLTVVDLIRTGFGPFGLKDLAEGEYRPATAEELATLRRLVGLEE